jgi:hypothetical protein
LRYFFLSLLFWLSFIQSCLPGPTICFFFKVLSAMKHPLKSHAAGLALLAPRAVADKAEAESAFSVYPSTNPISTRLASKARSTTDLEDPKTVLVGKFTSLS